MAAERGGEEGVSGTGQAFGVQCEAVNMTLSRAFGSRALIRDQRPPPPGPAGGLSHSAPCLRLGQPWGWLRVHVFPSRFRSLFASLKMYFI